MTLPPSIGIRNTQWGATPEQVKESEKWTYEGDKKPVGELFLYFTGSIFKSSCQLCYLFNQTEHDKYSLYEISYHFEENSDELFGDLKEVLLDIYNEPLKGRMYKSEYPMWIINGGQTLIKLNRSDQGIYIVMSHNGEDVEDRKRDYYEEAKRELQGQVRKVL